MIVRNFIELICIWVYNFCFCWNPKN